MKKVIFNLSMLVDEVIHEQMREFMSFGREAKLLQNSNKDIGALHLKMAEIFYNLKPFEYRMREMYPKMEKLFDIFSVNRENHGSSKAFTKVKDDKVNV